MRRHALALWAAQAPAAEQYIQENARLSGKVFHFFQQGSAQVTVVEGNFRLEVGQHVVTGDNAVVWITETPAGESVRRKIVVYVEGRGGSSSPAVRPPPTGPSSCISTRRGG